VLRDELGQQLLERHTVQRVLRRRGIHEPKPWAQAARGKRAGGPKQGLQPDAATAWMRGNPGSKTRLKPAPRPALDLHAPSATPVARVGNPPGLNASPVLRSPHSWLQPPATQLENLVPASVKFRPAPPNFQSTTGRRLPRNCPSHHS
jgi:hypothetical protein